ncbi:MAG TPA: ABC transporter permease [Solirubrobacteraceae bacterium]|jgi:ABC-2 type transport system permease protein|nr:ABC transporter permease [Solirubrobacteraceae bacterium]
MLKKDLLILARSRVLVAVLVLYPVAVALLIGLAISRAPGKPKVAIANLSPPSATVELGGTRLNVAHYYSQLIDQVQPVPVATRAAAVRAVRSGKALAAIVIPANIAARLSSVTSQAHVEVIYNGDALEQSFVHSTIESALAQANLELSNQIRRVAAQVIGALVRGGSLGVSGAPQNLPGLSEIPHILRGIVARHPHDADRAQLERLAEFTEFAAQNLGVSREVLSTVSQPIQVTNTYLHGGRTPLDAYAVVVAVSISLMFVCVLLAAGGIALEREEHTLARLVRGSPIPSVSAPTAASAAAPTAPTSTPTIPTPSAPTTPVGRHGGALITRESLIAQKLLLAAGCALVVAFAMLAGIGAFVGLEWSRVGQWLVALALGGLAFAALGVAIGALAREVRAASLLSFLLSLPLAFLALVPAGAVASGLYDAIRAISFVFPYKAALEALDAAVNRSSPGLAISLVHLLGLTALFAVLARLGLRRLD